MTQRTPRPWFRIETRAAAETEPAVAEVYIYDEIGESWWGGLAPKTLVDEIATLDVDNLTVHINSPGGAAWDGITIMNALRDHRARVNVVVDGLAASAASAIAMAGDTITMNRGAQMMIHDASGFAWGNAADMEKTAGVLHKLSDSYADIYAARAGGDREQWRALMEAETWYTAEEAVAAGLATSWDGDDGETVAATSSFDLSRFRFQGRAHAPAPMLAAASATAPATAAQTEASPMPSTVPGMVMMDEGKLAELRADAAAGRQAREEQTKSRRDAVIATALREGRITPYSATGLRKLLDEAEDSATELIQSLAPNTALPTTEIGHAAGEISAEEALWAKAFG